MKTRVLFVTDVESHLPHGGQCIRCYNLIDSLCQHFEVIVLAPRGDAACELVGNVQAWHELPRQRHRAMMHKVGDILYILAPRPTWAKCLRAICQRYKPHVTWFSFGHWGQYATIPQQFGSKTVMDAHNIQSKLTRQEYETLPFGKSHIANRLRYIAQRTHERYLFRRFDRVVSVSQNDHQYHARFVEQGRSSYIPNYIRETAYQTGESNERMDSVVAMTGNFDAFQNREGLAWFLSEAWPRIRRRVPRVHLQLIGHGSDSLFGQDWPPGVTNTGSVQTTVPYLRRATVAVVPLLHGSGTRFKILEAWACETPVVSTTLGAQGIDLVSGQSAILADSGIDFAREVVGLLQDSKKRLRLVQNGLDKLRIDHGFEVNTQRVRQLVEEALT